MNYGPMAAMMLLAASAMITVPMVAHPQGDAKSLMVVGAGLGSDVIDGYVKSFMAEHPGTRVTVIASSAGKGIAALLKNEAQIAFSSRDILDSEKRDAEQRKIRLAEKFVGYSGLVVVTKSANPVNVLTLDQIKKIFTAQYNNWNQVGGPDKAVRTLSRRAPESGGAVFFIEKVMDRHPFGPSTVFLDGWGSIAEVILKAADMPIGYLPMGQMRPDLKVIQIKKDEISPPVAPSAATFKDHSYPLVVPLKFYWDTGTRDATLVKFVDYCAGKAGAAQ